VAKEDELGVAERNSFNAALDMLAEEEEADPPSNNKKKRRKKQRGAKNLRPHYFDEDGNIKCL